MLQCGVQAVWDQLPGEWDAPAGRLPPLPRQGAAQPGGSSARVSAQVTHWGTWGYGRHTRHDAAAQEDGKGLS